MKVSLRKANAIQAAITEAISALKLETEVSINEFEDVNEKLDAASKEFNENNGVRENLLDALFEIRAAVSEANSSNGVNGLLAILAKTEKQISFYRNLARLQPKTDEKVLNGRIKKIADRPDDSRMYGGYMDEVNTSIFESGTIDDFKNFHANLKREKQKLQDELLELNVRTEIELTDQTVETLAKANII